MCWNEKLTSNLQILDRYLEVDVKDTRHRMSTPRSYALDANIACCMNSKRFAVCFMCLSNLFMYSSVNEGFDM